MSITKISPDVVDFDAGITISTTDNSDNLTLTSTDTDANTGPVLNLNRAVTGADDDLLGSITFAGQDDANNAVDYAFIQAHLKDASDGAEDGLIDFQVMHAGTSRSALILNGGGTVIVNQDSQDMDFRVESNGSANMLFVDGGNDRVGINTNSPLMRLHVKTAVGDAPSNDSNPPANGIAIFDSGGGYSLVIGTDDSNTGSAWIQSQSANTSSSEYDLLLNPNGGDVGIGVTNPAHALEINRASSSAAYAVVGNGGDVQSYIGVAGDNLPVLGSLTNHDLRLVTNATERMRIETSGFVSMGNTVADTLNSASGYSDLAVGDGSGNCGISIYTGTNHGGAIAFADGTSSTATYRGLFQYSHGDDSINWWTAGTQRLNLNSTNLFPQANDAMDLGGTSNKWDDIYATNDTIITSDRNEKNTIVDSDLGLSFIKELKPVSYKFNNKTRTHYGLIAQDVKETLDSISKSTENFAGYIEADVEVDENANKLNGEGAKWKKTGEKTYGLRYGEFIAPLIKAVQEQQTLIETLQAEVKALKGE